MTVTHLHSGGYTPFLILLLLLGVCNTHIHKNQIRAIHVRYKKNIRCGNSLKTLLIFLYSTNVQIWYDYRR